MVWLHLPPHTTSHTTSQTQESPLESSFDIDRAKELEQNLKYFRDKCDRLEIQISEQSTRHDAVVLKLSNTIERQQLMIDESKFDYPKEHKNYMVPQVLTNVNHEMKFMMEETFGPCVGILAVDNDNEGINLMNDSPYGLTASIWTKDIEAAQKLGDEVNTGTLFMNRCDYLDPGLSWTGVKETGKGCSLSEIAFEHLTKPKSFHLRKELK